MTLRAVDDRKRVVVPDPSKSPGRAGGYPQPNQGRGTSRQLVHELANLLDGSLRNITLALSELQKTEVSPPAESLDDDKLVARLQTVNQAMGQMATLIRRWQSSADLPVQDLHQGELTIGAAVEQAVELAVPIASTEGIVIRMDLTEQASAMPVGPVYPVIANALRNSIEALMAVPEAERAGLQQIELTGRVVDGIIELIISDTGPGFASGLLDESGQFRFGQTLKRQGRGVGLALCRDIAVSLGGTLELGNRNPRGAVVTLRYPVR